MGKLLEWAAQKVAPQGEQPQLHTGPAVAVPGSCEAPRSRVKGGLSGTVWQQMLLFGQKSERGPWWWRRGGLSSGRSGEGEARGGAGA